MAKKNDSNTKNLSNSLPFCEGSLEPFNPETILLRWLESPTLPSAENTFTDCIRKVFSLPSDDHYKYLAFGATTLLQTQKAIDAKGKAGLHAWYRTGEDQAVDPPLPTDSQAYTNLFSPSVSLPKALKAFESNARKDSLRKEIASYLWSRLHVQEQTLPSRKSRSHVNPYYDFWKYSCEELEWAGPWLNTVHTKFSHHILPIFYHHFGCVCPSYQALWVIAQLAQPPRPRKGKPVKPIFDIGSGNGYWTFMLRQLQLEPDMKSLEVIPVDDQTSLYRALWIADTVKEDGVKFLKQSKWAERNDAVLLLVYPQAGGDFTERVIRAFNGDTIVVAGTQNANGFTGFQECVVDEWVERNMLEFTLTMRFPLPSFAGKDDALFVFRRRLKE